MFGKSLIGETHVPHELVQLGHDARVPSRHCASQALSASLGTVAAEASRHTRGMERPNYLREWREQRLKWSQERLALEATTVANRLFGTADEPEPYSWGRTDVNRYENGVREPPLAFMRAVASMVRATIDDLLLRRPNEPQPVPDHLREVDPIWQRLADPNEALLVLRQLRQKE